MTSCTVNRDPEKYEKNKDAINAHLEEYLPAMIAKLDARTDELILDHGCGSGGTLSKYIIPYAEKNNSTVYGLDNSESMVAYARENFPHRRVNYMTGTLTATDSPVKDLKFNKIFSLFVLHHIKDYKYELQMFVEHLVPGGEMLLILIMKNHIFDIFKHVKSTEKFAKAAEDTLVVPQWLDQSEDPFTILKKVIEALPVQVKELSSVKRNIAFKNQNGFADFLFSMCPFAKNLPPEDYTELKEIYRKINRESQTKTDAPQQSGISGCEYVITHTALHALLKKV